MTSEKCGIGKMLNVKQDESTLQGSRKCVSGIPQCWTNHLSLEKPLFKAKQNIDIFLKGNRNI